MKAEAQRQANSTRPKLDNYEIDLGRGFLPAPDPLDQLPDDFSPWEELGREALAKLLIANKARTFIEGLPMLDANKLGEYRERKRAMAILSFLGHAYA